jgi:hypothetical protein
VAKG